MDKNDIRKAAVISGSECAVSEDELDLINAYTRRPYSAEELYAFSVVLCDNDVDRDGERFTVEALFALEKLFVGKTGIFDHDPSAKNQTARIFSCRVEAVPGRKTATGDDYFRLKARAYMPLNEDTRALKEAIDSGIIKEVSVGCAAERAVCSVCGKEYGSCAHRKGEVYSGTLCCGELRRPLDAYEWSFVAVPAQREAGVVKSAAGKERSMEDILKKLETGKSLLLSDSDCKKLLSYVEELRQSAKDGIYFRDCLRAEVLSLSASVQPGISRETAESMIKGLNIAQLQEMKTAYQKQKQQAFSPVPQLCGNKTGKSAAKNGQFTI